MPPATIGMSPHLARFRASLPAMMTIGIQGMSSLSNLVISWRLIREVGVAGFGYYAMYMLIAVNVTTIVSALLIQPLNSIASRFSKDSQEDYIAAAWFGQIVVMAGLVLLTGLTAAGFRARGLDVAPVWATAAFSITMAFGEFWRRIAFLRQQLYSVLTYDLCRYVLLALILVLTPKFYGHVGVTVYTLLFSAGYVLALGVYGVLPGSRGMGLPRYGFRLRARLMRMLRSGGHTAISSSMSLVSSQCVIFVAFFALGAYEAGLIRVAQTIVGLTNPAIQAMEHVVPATLGRRIGRVGLAPAIAEYRRSSITTLGGFLAMYAAISAASPFLLHLMGVKPGITGIWLVVSFCLTYFLIVVMSFLAFEVRAKERSAILSKSLVFTAAVAIVISYPCIRWFGLQGVVMAIGIPQILSIVILVFAIAKHDRTSAAAERATISPAGIAAVAGPQRAMAQPRQPAKQEVEV